MKIILKIILTFSLLSSMGFFYSSADENLNGTSKTSSSAPSNSVLKSFVGGNPGFIKTSGGKVDEQGIKKSLIVLAKDIKNIFFIIAIIYFLIIVIRVLVAENSEEEFGKFKKGILWITIGIVIMQLAYSFAILGYNTSYGSSVEDFSKNIINSVINPLLNLLQTAAAFFFIIIAIFAFYRMVTANGDEEKIKSGKMSVVYAIIGFIIIKFAQVIKNAVYVNTTDSSSNIVNDGTNLIFTIINWVNSFVGIVVVIMIIYIGAQVIFSNGAEEKLKKAKSSMLYVFVGILVLIMNYFILTFFLTEKII